MTVAAMIENEGRFLLVQQNVSGQSVFNPPAGHLEDNETLVEAVIRETLEETAWHFQPESVTGIYRWRHPEKQKTFMRVTFAGKGLYHNPEYQLDSCIERTVWLTQDEIRSKGKLLRSPMVLRSIEDYLSGVSYPLTLLTDIE